MIMKNVKSGKALGLDGVSDRLFKLDARWENNANIHLTNMKKIKFCKSLLEEEYLNSKEA